MIKEVSIEKIFLFISLIFGLIYVFILPPFQSVDEATHFYRSYEIISNKPIAQNIDGQVGDYLPSSLQELSSKYEYLIKNIDAKISPKDILNTSKIKLNKDKTEFIQFPNTALYSPICYLTQIPGMYIAKSFNSNPLAMLYFGRLSNLIFFSLIIYFTIKIIPFYKLTTMLLALMPMTLSVSSALTSDVIVIGMNFLWVAVLLKLIFEKEKINNFKIAAIILMAVVLALSKHYFMLIPLIFLIPKSNFSKLSKYLICTIGALTISFIALLLWQNIISGFNFNINGEADAFKQLDFILHNPFSYLIVLLKTLIIKTPRIIITMIGVLGWQDTPLDFLTYMIYPSLIALSIFAEKKAKFNFKKWQISLIGLDILLFVTIICSEQYLILSKVAAHIVYGLNGKYFIPIMLPFLLLLNNKINIKEPKNFKLFIYIALILILISSDLSILHRFYGLTPNLYYKI